MAFYDGFLLQTHPQITILHPKPITTAQPGGFFKAKYSMIGSPSVPSCGYMENVCSFGPHSATSDHLDFVAGSGKSVLWLVLPRLLPPTPSHNEPSSSIIQDIMTLYDAERASMAYFYFDFKDIDKQKLSNLLPSLLIQLSARSNPCCDILSRLYSVHDRGVRKPNDHVMMSCLKEMLALDADRPTYIIMDAIDECPLSSSVPSPREEVLELVNELVDLRLPNLHICVTSRPEFDIQAILESLAPHPVSLHNQSGQKQDIADYVSSFVHKDRRMRRWRDEDKDLVIKTLPEKADGM